VNPEIIKPGNGRGNGHGNGGNGNGGGYSGGSSVPYFVDAAPQHDGSVTGKLMLYAMFKRKWQVLAVLSVVVLSIVATGLVRPKLYRTNAKVLIHTGRAEVQVSAGDQARELTLPVSASTEMVNSEMEILRSKELMRRAIVRMEDAGTPIFGTDATMSVPEQVAALQGMIKVSPTPDSNVISIDLFAKNPTAGQAILGVITEVYLERHAQLRGSTGASDFFEVQKALLRTRLDDAEHRLASFIDDEGLVVPEDQIRWALKDGMRGREALGIHRSKIRGLEQRVSTLEGQIAITPEMVAREVERVNPAALGMAAHLAKLEAKRAALRQGFREDDRFVSDVDGEIAMIRGRIDNQESASVVGSTRVALNPVRQDLTRRLLNSQMNLSDLRGRASTLEEQIESQSAESQAEAVRLRQKSIQFARLESEIHSARASYELYQTKQEEARISEALDRERFLNVSILDGPSTPLRPVNAMSPFMLVAAMIAGTGLGVGSALGIEFFGRSFKFEEQVEQYLDMPVFAVIPELSDVTELTNPTA
jgi:uncharacterized protein involved in exopolysaccharide biosynthesis